MRSSVIAKERRTGVIRLLLPYLAEVLATAAPVEHVVETVESTPPEPSQPAMEAKAVLGPSPVPAPVPATTPVPAPSVEAMPKSNGDIKKLTAPYLLDGLPMIKLVQPRGEVMGQVDMAIRTNADAELSQPTMAVLQNPKGSMLAMAALKRANVEIIWNRSQRDAIELIMKELNERMQGLLRATQPSELIASLVLGMYE